MKKLTVLIVLVLFTAALPVSLFSQDSGSGGDPEESSITTDEDALFGGSESGDGGASGDENEGAGSTSEEDMFGGTIVEEISQDTDEFTDTVLSGGSTEIGGRYSFSAATEWSWDKPFDNEERTYDGVAMNADLGATLYLDARPSENFRVFAKGDITYPFSYKEGDSESGTEDRNFDDVFHVTELFSDFQLNNLLFFRGGKQTINWGVGYFYSPANLLNVTQIDPEDPEAELEGPLALKAQLPAGTSNYYLYLVPGGDHPENLLIAPKAETVIAGFEVGAGGIYRFDEKVAPGVMMTATGSLGDVDLFAEGVARYGADKTFIVEDEAALFGVSAQERDDEWFFSATAGFRYSWSDVDGLFNLSLLGQYYFNGTGYTEEFLDENAAGIGVLIQSGALSPLDVFYQPGIHYAGTNISWSAILGSDLSFSTLWIGNLSQNSHLAVPSLSWSVNDHISLSASARTSIGETGDEYSPAGGYTVLGISARLGGGSF